jgi:signal transduction histidine kinase/CheY-like chemotaxis protein
MADGPDPEVGRALRAELILAAAIALVSVLVIAIAAMLWLGARLHANEAAVVARVRDVRTEMIAATRAESDAEMFAARYLATRHVTLLTGYAAAKDQARGRMLALRNIATEDAEIDALVRDISNKIEQRFAVLDAEVAQPARAVRAAPEFGAHAALRTQATALADLLNQRIDAARAAEDAGRSALDAMGIALAALSLIASALAIYALRRERAQWRLAHRAAEEARARAAASDLAKTRFLAVASHDMRQPLHALTLYLSALERRVEGAEARGILEKMDRATQSMVGMFSTLLDLARIQAGVVHPEIGDFPLQDVIERIVAEHPDGQIEAAATTVQLRSDPLLIERILRNLASNALKHGGGHARIEVSAGVSSASVAVADDGPGIPAEDRERIFEEFVRLEGHGEGLGLGLAIVRRITELLDLTLDVQSPPSGGARFVLRVPLALADATPPTGGPARDGSLVGAPVIVVDDDALAREAMAGALRDLGAHVRACADASELETALDEGVVPRLLVMDLRIDGELHGIDIAERARARFDPPPPVIIVTGDTGPETLSALRASGHAWLIKPVDPHALTEAATEQVRAASAVSAT